MTKILVTGANGFIGNSLCHALHVHGEQPLSVVRTANNSNQIALGELDAVTRWDGVLAGCETVVHLAARVHVMEDTSIDSLAIYRAANVGTTLNLAKQAIEFGVKRFIFVSSIKVNGEVTQLDHPFAPSDEAAPLDAYGISKMEAEEGLLALSAETDIEVVIIRPPLVYGPGVKANFAAMMRWLQRGVPLPLGAIHNQRSLVALDNLVDLIVTCVKHPAAAGQVFLVSDGEDVSTTELLRRMGMAMGHPARLIPVPARVLELAAAMVGKQDVARRLCGSLQVDIEKTRRLLDWCPPLTLDQGLKKAAEGFGT